MVLSFIGTVMKKLGLQIMYRLQPRTLQVCSLELWKFAAQNFASLLTLYILIRQLSICRFVYERYEIRSLGILETLSYHMTGELFLFGLLFLRPTYTCKIIHCARALTHTRRIVTMLMCGYIFVYAVNWSHLGTRSGIVLEVCIFFLCTVHLVGLTNPHPV